MPDNMTPQQRSRTMARIRGMDTKPELVVRRLLFARGLRYRKYIAELPGKPDLVFTGPRVVVFVDGDFWHGWRFEEWEHKLSSDYWRLKIGGNRERDLVNQKLLEDDGWIVLRIWEHEIKEDADACVGRIEAAVRAEQKGSPRRVKQAASSEGGPADNTGTDLDVLSGIGSRVSGSL